MSKTITRLFDSHTQALDAVADLEAAAIHPDQISLVSNNTDNWHNGHQHPSHGPGDVLGDRNGDGDNEVADGAGKGAVAGGVAGAGAGLLTGLGVLAIPGLGPVVAAGWLVATGVGAVVGAAAGGAAGGLLGVLKEAGHSDDDAQVYAEGVRRGGTLISVKAQDDEIAKVEAALDGRRGVAAASRGAVYRQAGWLGFDPEATPYDSEEIQRERRAFSQEDDVAIAEEDKRRESAEIPPSLIRPY